MNAASGAAGFSIDLHVHTVLGSTDSSLEPEALAAAVQERGLGGVLLTEHDRICTEPEVVNLRRLMPGHAAFAATEWSTDMGHIIVVGLERRAPGLYKTEDVREYVLSQGGIMIAAHPFRYFLQPWHFRHEALPAERHTLTVAEAAARPLFRLVDAIETLNGNTTEEENAMARAVADHLGMPQTGGSDAHQARTLGFCHTLLHHRPEDIADLIAQIRAGRCCPARLPRPETDA